MFLRTMSKRDGSAILSLKNCVHTFLRLKIVRMVYKPEVLRGVAYVTYKM